MLKIALLDDYAQVALDCADWGRLDGKAQITVFHDHMSEAQAAELLAPFDVLVTIRERMALPRTLIQRLPNLKLITIVGMRLTNLDLDAASEAGVIVAHSGMRNPAFANVSAATPELSWGLLIATVRDIAGQDRRMRDGLWQDKVGVILAGRTLGLLGLGRIGKRMAEYAKVFGMDVIAWSQNLTAEAAAAVGVRRVEKDALFREADVVSIHLVLSDRTRGLVTARELGLMKPTGYLINTSRGPIRVHRRRRPRRVRPGAAPARPSSAHAGERHPDPAPGLRHAGHPEGLLQRQPGRGRGVRGRRADPGLEPAGAEGLAKLDLRAVDARRGSGHGRADGGDRA
jgi:phosphoglycerate dehydrogenase-like enzyme